MNLSKVAAAASLFAALSLLVVACTGQPPSPVSPGTVSAAVLSLEGGTGSCGDGEDNDKDGAIDCKDPECAEDEKCKEPPPPPPPPGNCSPGFFKNHPDVFNEWCDEAAALSATDAFDDCGDLLEAITCSGGPNTGCTGPRRQAAATALNTVSGCTE
jgi:hypothetical protein